MALPSNGQLASVKSHVEDISVPALSDMQGNCSYFKMQPSTTAWSWRYVVPVVIKVVSLFNTDLFYVCVYIQYLRISCG